MDELMAQLRAYDWGGDRGAIFGIDEMIMAAQGKRKKLAEIEAALLAVLESDTKAPAKEYICRKLALMGSAKSVPTLAAMLKHPVVSDYALLALEIIPAAAADKALRAALEEASGTTQVGIVNTLGERGDKGAVAALKKLRKGADGVLAGAVESALRKIEETSEERGLSQAKRGTREDRTVRGSSHTVR